MSLLPESGDEWLDFGPIRFFCKQCRVGYLLTPQEQVNRPKCSECGGEIISDREREAR